MGQDGNGPLLAVGGTLYGTTMGNGQPNGGTVYRINAAGKEQTLYRFTAAAGYGPSGPLADVDGTLYGTTIFGGTCGHGTVYALTTAGSETVLHSLCGDDGASPVGLTAVGGVLYGAASYNGSLYTKGTVFRITPSGDFTVLYAFGTKQGDALSPQTPPIEVHGALYGTTVSGGGGQCGNFGCGAVYRLSLTGSETVLYGFQGGSDGATPIAGLTAVGGTLYGTTSDGGSHRGHNGRKDSCCGTFYSLSLSGKHTVLRSFAYRPGASFPNTTLVAMNGLLYGTSYRGGVKQRLGTVYAMTHQGAEHVLYRFPGGTNGAHPDAALTTLRGKLYGTTALGGDLSCTRYGLKVGCGVVFSLTP